MTEKKTSRTCRDCGKTGLLADFVTGRNLCLSCQAQRQRRSRSKKRGTLDFSGNGAVSAPIQADNTKFDNKPTTSIFDNRESLTTGLRAEFESALAEIKELTAFNKDRLEKAKDSGDPDSVEEASRALQRSQASHVQLITRLSEKLQGLHELAAQAEKAKPVTFYFLRPGEFPELSVMRTIPAEYYPDQDAENNEVKFD